MEEQKYTMQGLEEYIRQGEPGQRERGEAWRVAIGLQQVDGLTPSSYLLDTYDTHIQSANSALKYSLKCKNCTLEDRLKEKGSRRTGKWEIVIVFLLSIFLYIGQVFAQSPNYNIGDVITNPDGSKGVVFWLSPDGSGGWMCALNDVSGTFAWSTQSVAVPGFPALATPSTYTWEAYATVTADTAGYSHTQLLRTAGNASTYPAAYAVDFAHGWYLPAIGQLLKLYGQQATISAVLSANGGSEISRTNYYWSSTYATNANGYNLNNPWGYWSTTSKSTAYYVRPVRSFSTQTLVYDTTLTYQWSNGATTPYANVSPSVSSSYTVTATSGFGCSNTAEVSVVVANGSSQTLYDTICAGSSGYALNGFNLTAAQTATAGDTVCTATLSEGTCSTTVTLHLHRKAPATATLSASICPGECYYLNGMELCNAGTYTQHLTAANGCDSTLTLHLSVITPDTTRISDVVCQGEPYTGYGFNIPADTTMIPHTIVETVHAPSLQTGCDSITILTLTVNNSTTTEFSASNCLNYTWNDSTYYSSGDKIQHFSAANGCDSVVTLHLTIIDTIRTDITDSACFFYTWHGITYEETGDYSLYYITAQGCDSMVTLHLTINHPQNQHYTITSCHSYTWEDGTGDTYYESGVYQHNHLDAHGCWQVDWLHLNINKPIHQSTTVVACETYTWTDGNGQTYTTGGDYLNTHEDANGCTQVDTLHLTINNPTHQATSITAYDSYIWNGTTYTQSGNYTFSHEDVNGCTQVDTLHLTLHYSSHNEFSATACEKYTWNDSTYYASGTYTQQFTDVHGADSVMTLHLTVNNPTHQSYNEEACETYTWTDGNSETYTESGTYTYSHQDAQYCTQTDTLHLTILHGITVNIEDQICQGEPYTGHGFDIPVDSTAFPHTIVETVCTPSLQTGCDSITILTLTVNPVDTVRFNETICQGEPYIGHGFNIPADSTMIPHVIVETQNFASLRTGCDSITILTLTVLPPVNSQFNATACGSYTWNGTTYTSSGNYQQTFTNHNGCDSTVTLHLTIYNPAHHSEGMTACGSYTWTTGNGQTYTASGTYTHSHTDSHGCTQVDTLHLTINQPQTINFTASVCQGQPYNGHGFNIPVDSTMIPHTIVETVCTPSLQTGCDSCTILTLTVNPVDTVRFNETICQGEPYNGHGFDIPIESTAFLHTIVGTRRATSLQTGCDSITILTLTVLPSYDITLEDRVCQGNAYENHGFNIPADSTMIPHIIVETVHAPSLQTGCDSTVTLNLSVIEESVIIIGPSVDFCETSTALLEAESPMSNFVWNTGETTQSIVVTSPGTYTVVAIEGNCSASAQYVITPCEFTLYLPNSITAANADGLNDIFQIAESQQAQIKDDEFSIVIYDRWGIKVFHSYDKAFQWDGKINGRVLQGNMYVYHITYKDLLNRFKTMRGTVITF